jgi:3-oxoacyl-[acyl-carrier-protein] synthase II
MVSPVGNSAPEFWSSVCEGRCGMSDITAFDTAEYDTRFAAQVHGFDPTEWMDPKLARRCDRFAQFAIAATKMALADSGLQITPENADDVGVIIGSGIGGMATWAEQHTILLNRGPGRVSPFLVPMMIVNMGSGLVAIETGAKGPNTAIATACATGTHAIGEAVEVIRRGAAQAMIAGGSEAAIIPISIAGFCAAKALSRRNDDPQHACRPFDRDRDGFVMGEGSTVVILEELEFAKARGANIIGELIGYGMSGDAYHITAPTPSGEGAARAMQAALDDAGLAPGDVQYVNAHAPGTVGGDDMEAKAIAQVWEGAPQPAVSSTKPVHGHQLGATGATEIVVCMLAIRDSLVPHTLNCDNPDDDIAIDIVRGAPRQMPVKAAMSNSFGFGGHNAVLIAHRYEQ